MIRYTYYSAATESYPNKQGINRITWEDNEKENQEDWTEITREYFPEDPREKKGTALEAFMNASLEEKIAIANELKKFLN